MTRYSTRHTLAAIAVLATLLALNLPAQAALVLQPAGLSPGDQYRLVFTTSTFRDATSSDIADYNNHVQAAADAAPLVGTWGLTWTAIASTPSVDAIDNTSTPIATLGIPVYLVDGTKVADNYADLWNLSIDAPINKTELDTAPPRPVRPDFGIVWTGTEWNGAGFRQLGGPAPATGLTTSIDSVWIRGTDLAPTNEAPLYAMSGLITAVPEPTAFLQLGLVGVGLAMIRYVRVRGLHRSNCDVRD